MNETIRTIMMVALLIVMAFTGYMIRDAQVIEDETIEPTMCPTNAELIDNLTIERNDAQHQATMAEYNLKQVQKNNTAFKDLRGQYNPNTGLIRIETAQLDTYEIALNTFKHEYAHKVWFEVLSEDERQYWEMKFKATENFPTEYAKTSVEEYYAEMYANDWLEE